MKIDNANNRTKSIIVDFSTISDKISNHYMPIVLNSKEDKSHSFHYYSVNYDDVNLRKSLLSDRMPVYKRARDDEKNIDIRKVPLFDIRASSFSRVNHKIPIDGFMYVSNKNKDI